MVIPGLYGVGAVPASGTNQYGSVVTRFIGFPRDNHVNVATNKKISWRRIRSLRYGNAAFTTGLGLEFDGSMANLGTRSKRYAMIVDDGTVTKLAVEDPGQFEVSAAEAILGAL